MKCEHPNCKAPALRGETKCYFHSHDPAIVEKRRASTSKGGRKRNKTVKIIRLDTGTQEPEILTVENILTYIHSEIQELQALKKLDLNEHTRITIAKTIAQLARVAIMAISGHIVAKDISKIMSDIEKLKTIRGKY